MRVFVSPHPNHHHHSSRLIEMPDRTMIRPRQRMYASVLSGGSISNSATKAEHIHIHLVCQTLHDAHENATVPCFIPIYSLEPMFSTKLSRMLSVVTTPALPFIQCDSHHQEVGQDVDIYLLRKSIVATSSFIR